ncbi:MAG TPA: YqiA/YcfP family alpha/beta fold hydrolase [Polyangia bacterium]
MDGPRWLYCHGFASGPRSHKGVELAARFAARGVELERLDLRVPSLERLSFAAMQAVVVRAIGGARDRAVVFGSSLGGLTAARVAEADARVCALVLLAPAFRLAERWRTRLGADEWRKWESSGWLDIHDYAEDRPARVSFDFIRELDALDAGWPDMPDVRVPTLIVHGSRDDTVDPQLSRDFARGKSWVRLVEVDDGHELAQSLARIGDEAENFLRGFLGS